MPELTPTPLDQLQDEIDAIRDAIEGEPQIPVEPISQQLLVQDYSMRSVNWRSTDGIGAASRYLEVSITGKPIGKSKARRGTIVFLHRDDLPQPSYSETHQRITIYLHEADQPFVLEQLKHPKVHLHYFKNSIRTIGELSSEPG